ncbi:hypothetical protein [Breoghania sp. L-A4]|uniref:hypothetical protein n=1 Tax=Breoghania sp. L-A4 TaxID=2304600 RepID=UPI000E3607B5|nr:hypothetical protein [Breoghania sp. L-A4]AXS40845.1 hypothetical protein D1F64_13330 [Breoghania sp. L-A4]
MAIPVSRLPQQVMRGALRAGLLALMAAIAFVLMLLVAGGGRADGGFDPLRGMQGQCEDAPDRQ